MTTTLKVDWDADTIAAVRVACLAVGQVYESLGALPGCWNLADAGRLFKAAEDIRAYVEAREQVKQEGVVRQLLNRQQAAQDQETSS
jgi:hypothetical protein